MSLIKHTECNSPGWALPLHVRSLRRISISSCPFDDFEMKFITYYEKREIHKFHCQFVGSNIYTFHSGLSQGGRVGWDIFLSLWISAFCNSFPEIGCDDEPWRKRRGSEHGERAHRYGAKNSREMELEIEWESYRGSERRVCTYVVLSQILEVPFGSCLANSEATYCPSGCWSSPNLSQHNQVTNLTLPLVQGISHSASPRSNALPIQIK